MNQIVYSNINKQIEKLKTQNLIISDEKQPNIVLNYLDILIL